MAKSSSQQTFAKVARAANSTCHKETTSTAAFKKCMRREMDAGLKKAGFKVGSKCVKRRKGRCVKRVKTR